MKNTLEIPVLLVHRGGVREIVALALDGSCPAADFLLEVGAGNPKGLQILRGQFHFLGEAPEIRNRETFKLLDADRSLFEFRTRFGLRLYCFLDGRSLVILTNGGKKNSQNSRRVQDRDIQQARNLQDRYLGLKTRGATLLIREHED